MIMQRDNDESYICTNLTTTVTPRVLAGEQRGTARNGHLNVLTMENGEGAVKKDTCSRGHPVTSPVIVIRDQRVRLSPFHRLETIVPVG